MTEKIEHEIETLEGILQTNIGEQEAYAVRYAILVLKNLEVTK